MRVLVTGSSGFVGSALGPALKSRGHEPRAGSREPLSLRSALSGCEAVVHLANVAHASARLEVLQRVNIEGTRRVAGFAAELGAKRFVYLSSVKASGEETTTVPFDGPWRGVPDSEYGRAKLEAERALAELAAATGLEVVVLRPPLVYGPGVKANFLALMRAVQRGWALPFASVTNRRSLVYVGNLADAIVRCLEAPEAAGRTYLVSDGTPVSTPDLIRALGQALHRPAWLVPFPPRMLELAGVLVGRGDIVKRLTRSLEVDDGAIRRELSWAPPFTFEEGIRLTAEWYLRERSGRSG